MPQMVVRWRDVFDAYNLVGKPDIYKVNSFLWQNTTYRFFLLNGKVYMVNSPESYDMNRCDTGITVDDLIP